MEDRKNRRLTIFLDVPFTIRTIKRWLFLIICFAMIAGAATYVAMDYVLKESYSATATVAVVPKTNSNNALNDSIMNTAISKNISMWKSNSLRKVIMDANPDLPVEGYLNASNLRGSGLVLLTSTADTAEHAYYLLSAALKNYHKIEHNFDTNYSAVLLTHLNASSISVDRKNPVKYAVLAFGGVGALWGFLLILYSLVSNRIHTESQARKLLETSVLQSIPATKKKGSKAILISQNTISPDYITCMDRLTINVEQYLRKNKEKVILVTSLQENEGKSTIAANLALNLARRGNRTVLLDVDFRQPAIYKIFEKKKEKKNSFSELLKNDTPFLNVIEKREDQYGLEILYQFKKEKDSDRMLEKVDFGHALDLLKDEYDIIVLDTPPIAPVRDVDVISPIAGNVLMVIRQDFDHATEINDAIDDLEEFGAVCVGTVLNNCQNSGFNKSSRNKAKRKQKNRSTTKKRG